VIVGEDTAGWIRPSPTGVRDRLTDVDGENKRLPEAGGGGSNLLTPQSGRKPGRKAEALSHGNRRKTGPWVQDLLKG
jgi:hypothetical protein